MSQTDSKSRFAPGDSAGSEPRILILNGPNLNLLGSREPDTYGDMTLAEVGDQLDALATDFGATLEHVQSNHEGVLVDTVHLAAKHGVLAAVVNAGAYTHTSIALRDAFAATNLPFVEVHVSNVYARESFRHTSLLAPLAAGVIVGFGPSGYMMGLLGLMGMLGLDAPAGDPS